MNNDTPPGWIRYQPSKSAKPGDHILYNDERPGHTNVKAEILSVDGDGMTVQFEDRADTTRINFQDRQWMDHLTFL
jgi:hypothetical protein